VPLVAPKNWRQCFREVSRMAHKIASLCSRPVQVGSQTIESVCSQNMEGGTQKTSQCPRDVSRLAAKKWRQCAS
jgi:hypothetical protein